MGTRGPSWPHPHAHLRRRYRYAMLISTSPRLSTTSRRHPALVAATMARGRLGVCCLCRRHVAPRLAPCLNSAPGGANSGTILPGGSSGFVVDSRGRPGATGSRQAAPVSLVASWAASLRESGLCSYRKSLRLPIVDSENRPLWTKSNQSLQGSPQRRQSAFFGLPCLPSHPKMGCGAAAAEVQSKKGARQSLCCVTRSIPPCRTAGVAMSRNLRLGVCASRLSDEPISTLSRMDANHHSRQMVPKRSQEKKAIGFPCAHQFGSQLRDKTLRGGAPHGPGPKGTVDEQHRGTRPAADGHTASEPAARTKSWGIGYFLASVPPRATSLQTRCGRRHSSGTLSRGCFDKNCDCDRQVARTRAARAHHGRLTSRQSHQLRS